MQDPFVGEIAMFAGNFAPRGWALCDGQLLPINQNQALFSLLGTTYGGDGRTTFALPDLRGRAPVHAGTGPGQSPVNLGEQGGSETVTLTPMQMPAHTHMAAGAAGKTTDQPGGSIPSGAGAYGSAPGSEAMDPRFIQSAGGSQPFDNRPPFLGVNYIIALQGIFPSRD